MTHEHDAASATAVAEAKRHNDLGALLHLDADLAGARREYDAALAVDPTNATALNNLGFVTAQEGTSAEPSSSTRRRSGRTRPTRPPTPTWATHWPAWATFPAP